MATTTRSNASPIRRSLVWSQNTSYTGAAGVHSEVSRKANAFHVTGQRQLDSSLSGINSLHKKEMRSLSHHRKSLETSMLAYTEKMRRISTDRLSSSHSYASSSLSGSVPISPSSWEQGSVLDRLVSVSKAGPSSSTAAGSGGFVHRTVRVSVDSGIDVNEAYEERDRKLSESRHLLAVSAASSAASSSVKKSRPSSFNSCDEESRPVEQSRRRNKPVASPPNSTRQRRPGTTEKPDISALRLSQADHHDGTDSADRRRSSSSFSPDDVSAESPPAVITPFPEFKLSHSEVTVDSSGILVTPDLDEERQLGTSSRTSQSSKKKFSKTRENYWSYRKARPRYSIHATSSLSSVKNSPVRTDSPRLAKPKPVRKLRVKTERSKKPTESVHSFRYSDVVQDVLKSLDESSTEKTQMRAARRASEILPALDVEDISSERRRLKEGAEKAKEEPAHTASKTPSPDPLAREETPAAAEAEDQGGLLVPAVTRERSLSAPDILSSPSVREDSDVDDDDASVEELIVGLKSVLRKFETKDFLSNVPQRKSVQFCLPAIPVGKGKVRAD